MREKGKVICTVYCNVVRGHCGTCNQTFSRCLDHGDTRFNRCVCDKTTRHPEHPEEWR